MLTTYQGEIFETYQDYKNRRVIRTMGKRDGFKITKDREKFISTKIINEDEIGEIFEVYFFATWKGDEFSVSVRENQILFIDISYAESRYHYFVDENGFEMRDRGEFCKFVPESECSDFVMTKEYYENGKWVEKERKKLTLEEFKKSYYEYVGRFK